MTKMKWLGWINLYFLLCGVALVAVLFDKSDVIAKNKIEVVEEHLHAKALPTLDQKRGEVRSGYDIAELLVVNDDKIGRGKELYASNCASCHGQEGKGDGAPLSPPPRNFHSLDGWTNGPEISNIFKTLTEGIAGTGMSSYGTLPVEDRIALAHFIRTLTEGYPAIGSADEKMLKEVYELDQDKKDKSIVPVEVAMEVLVSEVAATSEKADKLASILAGKGFKSSKTLATALLKTESWKQNSVALSEFIYEVEQSTTSPNIVELSGDAWSELLAELSNVN